jgi:hypothetical protein
MNYNTTYFNCTIGGSCDQKIGYTQYSAERIVIIVISLLGVLSNFFLIIYNLVKRIKEKVEKHQ